MCGLFLFGYRCGLATEATATTAAAKAAVATAIAATTVTAATTTATATATATAAVAAGQAVNAGAGGVWLAAGSNRFAVGQIQTCKLGGFQGIDVAWQLVTVIAAAVLTTRVAAFTMAALRATAWTTALWAWTTRCGTALTIATVVKTRVAALLLAATTVATAFTATIALAFKARCALWALWSVSA